MYSQQKDIVRKVYGKCCISQIFELSLYSLCRFCLLIVCISYLFYALVLSFFLFDKFRNDNGIASNLGYCTKNQRHSKIPINFNAFGIRNSKSISKMIIVNKMKKRKRRQEPQENSSDTSQEIDQARRSKFSVFHKKDDNIYILIWTNFREEPFRKMGKGRRIFKKHKCPYTNCYVTSNINYFPRVTKFDVILFGTPEVTRMSENDFPLRRLSSQRYIFVSAESAYTNRICDKKFDYFFNLTWSYKLDSDIKRGIVVRNIHNEIIGPQAKTPWMITMDPKNYPGIGSPYPQKVTAAAWWPTKCRTNSSIEVIASNLQKALKARHLALDIYGDCGSGRKRNNFGEVLNRMYYFYLAFEDALSPDYVTPTLLHALNHDVIPIVYGGADYSRFMPDGSYIDASKIPIPQLANIMLDLINNKTKYASYFRWKNYYTYHLTDAAPETNEYCQLCAMLNIRNYTKISGDFTTWWNHPKC